MTEILDELMQDSCYMTFEEWLDFAQNEVFNLSRRVNSLEKQTPTINEELFRYSLYGVSALKIY